MDFATRFHLLRTEKRTYLLSGLIVCGECGTKYVGRTSTNKKGYQSAHYHCGNKYRTRTCKAKNINANVIETFVVSNLKDYLLKIDYQELAERVADQINNASPNLEAEKKELAIIDNKIHNGVKAILSGIRLPELDVLGHKKSPGFLRGLKSNPQSCAC